MPPTDRPARTVRKFNSDDSLRDSTPPAPAAMMPVKSTTTGGNNNNNNNTRRFADAHRQSQHGFPAPPPLRRGSDYDSDDEEDDSGTVGQKRVGDNPSRLDFFKQAYKASKSRGVRFWAAVVCGSLILLLLILALILYFYLWVGSPDVKVLRVIPPQGDFKNNAVIDLGDQAAGISPSMTVNVKLEVQISNPNRMDLSLENVQIRAFHPLVPDLQIASAFLDTLVLPKEGTVVQEVPLSLQYKFSDDPDSKIPNDLVASCTVPAGKTSPEKQLQILVTVDTKLRVTAVIKPTVPTIRSDPSFDCPFTGAPTFNVGGTPINLARIDWAAVQKGKVGYLPG